MFLLNSVKGAQIGGLGLNLEISIQSLLRDDITEVFQGKLSFELIVNSLRDLEDWYRENKGQKGVICTCNKIHEDAQNQRRACSWQRSDVVPEKWKTTGRVRVIS